MKLKNWIEYNKELMNCDLIVCALKSGSFKYSDKIFEAAMNIHHAKKIFGEHEIKRISVGEYPTSSDSYGLKVLIWIDEIDNTII